MKKLMLGMFILCLLNPWPINAQTPEQKGLDIAVESEVRDTGWGDHRALVRMVLRNKHGQKSERRFRYRTLEMIDGGVKTDGDKVLIIFDNPKDVKGTALLTFSHIRGDDDQWLYLPALKRVKRISARNKTGSFVGSEFAYEDIATPEVDKYSYQWTGDQIHNSRSCFVVERYPVDKRNSGYTRQVVWYDQAEYRIRKIQYYDRKNALLKTLEFDGYDQYLEKHWRPRKMYMVNHQNGKSTLLEWSDYQFRTGLKKRDFTKHTLKRAR